MMVSLQVPHSTTGCVINGEDDGEKVSRQANALFASTWHSKSGGTSTEAKADGR